MLSDIYFRDLLQKVQLQMRAEEAAKQLKVNVSSCEWKLEKSLHYQTGCYFF